MKVLVFSGILTRGYTNIQLDFYQFKIENSSHFDEKQSIFGTGNGTFYAILTHKKYLKSWNSIKNTVIFRYILEKYLVYGIEILKTI